VYEAQADFLIKLIQQH